MEQWSEKEKNANGFFTLEATLCMPVILGCFFFTLFALFYIHDSCLLETETLRILVAVSECKEEGKEQTDYMKAEAAKYFDHRYMWFSLDKLTVYSEKGKTGLSTENVFQASGRKMKIIYEKCIPWRNPLFVLRMSRKITRHGEEFEEADY